MDNSLEGVCQRTKIRKSGLGMGMMAKPGPYPFKGLSLFMDSSLEGVCHRTLQCVLILYGQLPGAWREFVFICFVMAPCRFVVSRGLALKRRVA